MAPDVTFGIFRVWLHVHKADIHYSKHSVTSGPFLFAGAEQNTAREGIGA